MIARDQARNPTITAEAKAWLVSGLRVTSKQELKDRIMAAMDHFNQAPASTSLATRAPKLLILTR
jgi:hypothetical protein